MSIILIKDANIVNEGKVYESDILIKDGFINKIGSSITENANHTLINAKGNFVIPGAIDDQVD